MTSSNSTSVLSNWEEKVGDWSEHEFENGDRLDDLLPYMKEEFPTPKSFDQNVLISRLKGKDKADWSESINNLSQQNKPTHLDFSKRSNSINSKLNKQVAKLKDNMFIKDLYESVDSESIAGDEDSEEESPDEKKTSKKKGNGKKSRGSVMMRNVEEDDTTTIYEGLGEYFF
jgi:hypothetical protein